MKRKCTYLHIALHLPMAPNPARFQQPDALFTPYLPSTPPPPQAARLAFVQYWDDLRQSATTQVCFINWRRVISEQKVR